MTALPDKLREPNLASHTELRENRLRARNCFRALGSFDAGGNLQILNRFNGRRFSGHLGMVQKEDASRKKQNERSDEQPKVQM